MLSKNSPKAVNFDRCTQLLVLQCASRLGVALQDNLSKTRDCNREASDLHFSASFKSNDATQTQRVQVKTNGLYISPLPKGGRRFVPKTESGENFSLKHSKVLAR
jgi:hypothetical protein